MSTSSARPGRARPLSRDAVENRVLAVVRPLTIAVLLVVAVFPFVYMATLSVRDLSAVVVDPGRLLPTLDELGGDAYTQVLSSVDAGGQGFLGFIRNSLLVAVGTVVLTLALSVPAAHAVTRLRFPGRERISVLFLAVYLFPTILLAVPLFIVFTKAGLRGSLVVLVVVYAAQTVAVSLYMLRGYFATVPESLEEAAALDGLSRLGILRRISIPLAAPAIASNALFVFMVAWNEFLFALLFLVEDRSSWTVSLGLAQLAQSLEVPTTVLMAGSIVLTVPIVVIFFASQRLLTGGLTEGADKG